MLLFKYELIITQLSFPSKNVFCNLMSFQWQNHSKLQVDCNGDMGIHNRRECVWTKWKHALTYN
jgi:hypothetical protein